MNPSQCRDLASSALLRVLWVVVALVVGFGAGKAPQVMVLTHSHAYQAGVAHTHHDYQDFVEAEKQSPEERGGGKPYEHSHRIAVQVDAPAVMASEISAEVPEAPPTDSVLLAADNRNGPRRPADLLIRPPQALLS